MIAALAPSSRLVLPAATASDGDDWDDSDDDDWDNSDDDGWDECTGQFEELADALADTAVCILSRNSLVFSSHLLTQTPALILSACLTLIPEASDTHPYIEPLAWSQGLLVPQKAVRFPPGLQPLFASLLPLCRHTRSIQLHACLPLL